MGKILDNPKEFFDSLSLSEFDNMLKKYGFEYEDISKQPKEVQAMKKYIQNVKISMVANNEMNHYLKLTTKVSKSVENIYKSIRVSMEKIEKFNEINNKKLLNIRIDINKKSENNDYNENKLDLEAA